MGSFSLIAVITIIVIKEFVLSYQVDLTMGLSIIVIVETTTNFAIN